MHKSRLLKKSLYQVELPSQEPPDLRKIKKEIRIGKNKRLKRILSPDYSIAIKIKQTSASKMLRSTTGKFTDLTSSVGSKSPVQPFFC
jgi:hypothetical protein